MKRKIAWKYHTPVFGSNIEDIVWPNDKLRLPFPDDDDDEVLDRPSPYEIMEKSKPFKILSTPFGVIRWDDDIASSNKFLSWVGFSNFDLTESAIKKLIHIPGVEAVRVFSRYRFLLVVGELFDTAQVKIDIQRALCEDIEEEPENLPLDKTTTKQVDALIDSYENFSLWVIYVLPNGRIESACSLGEDHEFDKLFMVLCSTFNLVGGAIFTP